MSGVGSLKSKSIMKHFFIVLTLMCSLCLHAKDGKIKYGKFIVYEGEIENKQPKGQGILKLLNPQNKQASSVEIVGQFDGNNVLHAKMMGKESYLIDSINITYYGDKGKCNNIDVVLNNIVLNNVIIGSVVTNGASRAKNNVERNVPSLKVEKMKLEIKLMSTWTMGYKSPNIVGIYLPNKIPPILEKLQYKINMIDKVVEVIHLNSDGTMIATDSEKYILKNGVEIKGNEITYPTGSKVEIDKDMKGWTGTRSFSNGIKVSCEKVNNDYIVNLVDPTRNETYTGTIKNVFEPLYPTGTLLQYTGTQIIDGVVTKWIKGESVEKLHERLKDKLAPKWLTMVEEGKISEQDAIAKQEEEKIQNEKKDLCAKILWEKWKCKQIAFEGKLEVSEGEDYLRGLFGIDHTFFDGRALLGLDDNGCGVFIFEVSPSGRAYNSGRGRALQINGISKDIAKHYKGMWSLEGNKLFIDGKDTGLVLSNDGKTFKYVGMLGSTLKIVYKYQESARKND